MKKDKCIDCKYWDFLSDGDDEIFTLGECRRYPPVRQAQDSELAFLDTYNFYFPTVREIWWCGEFIAKAGE